MKKQQTILIITLVIAAVVILALSTSKKKEQPASNTPTNAVYTRSGKIAAIPNQNRLQMEIVTAVTNAAGVAEPKTEIRYIDITPATALFKNSAGKSVAASISDFKVGQTIIFYTSTDSQTNESLTAQKLIIQ